MLTTINIQPMRRWIMKIFNDAVAYKRYGFLLAVVLYMMRKQAQFFYKCNESRRQNLVKPQETINSSTKAMKTLDNLVNRGDDNMRKDQTEVVRIISENDTSQQEIKMLREEIKILEFTLKKQKSDEKKSINALLRKVREIEESCIKYQQEIHKNRNHFEKIMKQKQTELANLKTIFQKQHEDQVTAFDEERQRYKMELEQFRHMREVSDKGNQEEIVKLEDNLHKSKKENVALQDQIINLQNTFKNGQNQRIVDSSNHEDQIEQLGKDLENLQGKLLTLNGDKEM